jgi:hypothetical protein
MIKTIKHISLFVAVISLASCGGSEKNPTETTTDSVAVKTAPDNVKDIVLYNIPSPLETFTILKMSGSTFDKALMNPSSKSASYVSNYSKAINLGTYSTDLSFCFLYKQNQDFNNYVKNISDLTTSLGIDGSYGQEVTKRLQANASNLDSLMGIVSEASLNADEYLKTNQRDNTTALIAAGAWVEAMHVIVTIADKKQNKDIVSLVGDQKIVLGNLIKMLEQFESDADTKALLTDMKDVSSLFESLQPTKSATTFKADENNKSIGTNTAYELTKEQVKAILDKIEALRTKLTK